MQFNPKVSFRFVSIEAVCREGMRVFLLRLLHRFNLGRIPRLIPIRTTKMVGGIAKRGKQEKQENTEYDPDFTFNLKFIPRFTHGSRVRQFEF